MSSMRNAVQRRPHRERTQPHERRHLGLLEKHKDYALRAKDFNRKKQQLRALRLKASLRNEDEFYFGMVSQAGPGTALTRGRDWDGTVPGRRREPALSVDAVRLLKTQDLAYVRTARTAAVRQLDKLVQRAAAIAPAAGASRPVVFFASEAERRAALAHEVEDGAPRQGVAARAPGPADSTGQLLRQARERAMVLAEVEQALNEQKAKMAKTATSGGITKNGKRRVVLRRKR